MQRIKIFVLAAIGSAALLCTAIPLKAADSQVEGTWDPGMTQNRTKGKGSTVNFSVEKGDVPDMGNVSTLVIQGDESGSDASTIELGRIPSDIGKQYRAVYYIKAEVDEPSDSPYLMIREYAVGEGGTPLNREYHKLPSHVRRITDKDIGHWIKKEFSFTTGEGAEFLGAAIAVPAFKGRITISPMQLLPDEDGSSAVSQKKKLKR